MSTDAKIFLIESLTGQLNAMPASDYLNEDQLQAYLEDYPDLLPGDQINPAFPRRWLLIAREMGVPGEADGGNVWSLDHLFLDQDGIPTFVECKRAVDTRTRREVVAQMLDYAANGIVYWSVDRLRQAASETANRQCKELDDLVYNLIDGATEEDIDAYWDAVEANLRQGRVRLLFVVNKAPAELRRLVEFLNEKMEDVEALIVELTQYQGDGQTALVPRVIGQTQQTSDRKAGAYVRRKSLTKEEFLHRCSPEGAKLCQEIWRMAEERGYPIVWNAASATIRILTPDSRDFITTLYTHVGEQPGGEHLSFYFYDDIRDLPQTPAMRQKILETGLFTESGKWTLVSGPFGKTNPGQVLAACELIMDGSVAMFAAIDEKGKPRITAP